MPTGIILRSLFFTIFTFMGSLDVLAKEFVNIYSARHYDTDLALYREFEEKTGIKVNRIEAESDTLIERIVNEGKYSPADILVTVDAGRLYRAEQRGIFAKIESDLLNARIPENLRHPDGLWYGLSKRARVIIYRKEDGKPENLNTYQDLAKADFKGKLCMRSSRNIYNTSLLASMISHQGSVKAEAWAKGVVANLYKRPSGNDTSNIKAVASGECGYSLVNSYYIARFIAGGNSAGKKVGVIYPNQDGYGTHVNISGAGVLKHAPNRENAIKFLEYLTESRPQTLFVAANNEYPVVKGASVSSALAELGEFKEDLIDARELGVNQAEAVKTFDRAGWH